MIARSRFPRTLIWLLLAAALLARAALPAGWMPVAEAGGVRIALCTGLGTETLTLGRDGRLHRDAPQREAPRDPCPFGIVAAQAASLPPAIELPLPPASLAAIPAPAFSEVAAPVSRNLRPPARGPPTLA